MEAIFLTWVTLSLFDRFRVTHSVLLLAMSLLGFSLVGQLQSDYIQYKNLFFIVQYSFIPIGMLLAAHRLAVRDVRGIQCLFFVVILLNAVLFALGNHEGDFAGSYTTGSQLGAIASLFAVFFFVRWAYSRGSFWVGSLFALGAVLLWFSEHRAGLLALLTAIYVAWLQKAWVLHGLRAALVLTATIIFSFCISVAFTIFFREQIFFNGVIGLDTIRSAGRFTVWPDLAVNFASGSQISWFFGQGLGSASLTIESSHAGTLDQIALPHNEYLRLLLDVGFFGLLAYLATMAKVALIKPSIASTVSRSVYSWPLFTHFLIEMCFSNVINWTASYVLIAVILAKSGAHTDTQFRVMR